MVCACVRAREGRGDIGAERGDVEEDSQTVSGDDTHNEEYCGCVILIIPLTPTQSLMLFDSSQQPC